MGLIDDIRNQVKKSGTNKGKFLYFKPGVKVRIRFLQDIDEGMKIPFHDSYAAGINVPCQELFGRKCKYCDNEDLRHRDQYMWSVWDHESKEVKLLLGPVNNASPIPGLVGAFDAYGTLTDRDYVITKNGSGPTATFSVVGMDKSKFRNEKAKPFSKSKALELLDKAFPDDGASDDDEDDKGSKSGKKDYSDMSAKELYDLCQGRGIECKPRQSKDYYIDLLEADDDKGSDDGWGDDDWGDESDDKPDYDSMSAKELYALCKERDIDVEPRKPESYYIKKLKAADEAGDDDGWGDDDKGEEDDEW